MDAVIEEAHPDIKNLIITSRNIKDYIPSANSRFEYNGIEPSLVDEYLEVNFDCEKYRGARVGTFAYSSLTPEQRALYLLFLQNPYDKRAKMEFVNILFYGLERHLVYGKSGAAADVIIELRKHHRHRSFLALSFNALVYISKKSNNLLNFLKSEYYSLCVDFTMYYHLMTDKHFPAEALIRFKKHFGFPHTAQEINPAVFKSELEKAITKKKNPDAPVAFRENSRGYPLEKQVRVNAISSMENLPFPANRSMDKLTNRQLHAKPLHQIEPLNSEIGELIKLAYLKASTSRTFEYL